MAVAIPSRNLKLPVLSVWPKFARVNAETTIFQATVPERKMSKFWLEKDHQWRKTQTFENYIHEISIPVDSSSWIFGSLHHISELNSSRTFLTVSQQILQQVAAIPKFPDPFGRMESFVHLMITGKLRDLLMFHHCNGRKVKEFIHP